jgi:hypothetical protein
MAFNPSSGGEEAAIPRSLWASFRNGEEIESEGTSSSGVSYSVSKSCETRWGEVVVDV